MKIKKFFSIVLSVFVSFSFVFAVTYAATTISTNIDTGGTLTVTGNSTLISADIGGGYTAGSGSGATISAAGAFSANGDLAVNGFATTTASNGNFATKGTLNATGLTTLVNATTTMVSVSGNLWVGGNATTTSAGAFTTNGLATFMGGATTTILTLLNGEVISNATDGVIQLGGVASTTSITLLNGETITNATDGEVQITATALKLVGTASTSAVKVGDEPAAPTINGMVFGYCSFGDMTLAASSTAGFANCTATPAGALLANDRVFVQATSSFESMYIITAASTTDANTIQLRILNTGLGTADGTLSGTSVNFWAVR